MPYRDIAPFPKRLTIMIGLFVVGGMSFGLALSYYKNVLFDRQLAAMQQQNAKLKKETLQGYQDLEYFRSDQLKDKYAKQNIGLVNPGEKVLILPNVDEPVADAAHELTEEEKQAIYEENLRSIRIIDHWKIFLFHREKIEELRKRAEG